MAFIDVLKDKYGDYIIYMDGHIMIVQIYAYLFIQLF